MKQSYGNFQGDGLSARRIDSIRPADVVEINKFGKWNKGMKYLLVVIHVFSNYAWIEMLKDENGETWAKANIFSASINPKMSWTDKRQYCILKALLSCSNNVVTGNIPLLK